MNNNKSLKRKRSNIIMKSVRFDSKVIVLETYSSDEYDRSDIFSTPVLYKINPSMNKPQLSLQIPNLILDEEEEAVSSAEIITPNTPPNNTVDHYFINQPHPNKKKKLKPLLTVDTTICSDPLFFTGLSTHYKNMDKNDTSSDFLVPISATTTTPSSSLLI